MGITDQRRSPGKKWKLPASSLWCSKTKYTNIKFER